MSLTLSAARLPSGRVGARGLRVCGRPDGYGFEAGEFTALHCDHGGETMRAAHVGRCVTAADLRRLLRGLAPPVKTLVLALRAVIHRHVPSAVESILWGGLSYHRPEVGGRVRGAVCLISFKRSQVRLEFIHGIRMADPSNALQGQLVSKRFVPIARVDDTRRPEIGMLIREAAALDPAEWTRNGHEALPLAQHAMDAPVIEHRGRTFNKLIRAETHASRPASRG